MLGGGGGGAAAQLHGSLNFIKYFIQFSSQKSY